MVWLLLVAGCQVSDADLWSRSEPGWDLGLGECWGEEDLPEEPEETCQRELVFELTDWEGEGGVLTGTWSTGDRGEGTVEGEWTWLDDATREVTGSWEDDTDPEHSGELYALAWVDDQSGPQIFGWATYEGGKAWIGGPGEVFEDGALRGEVTWSFTDARLEGRFLPNGSWYGHGQWDGSLMYAEGGWETVDEGRGQLFGTVFHDQWSGPALGSFDLDEEGVGTANLEIDRWGIFDGSLVFDGAQAATFDILGYPEGC